MRSQARGRAALLIPGQRPARLVFGHPRLEEVLFLPQVGLLVEPGQDVLGTGERFLDADLHVQQFRFIANRRARQVGVEEPFPGAENVLPWLDEQANLRKEKNFFETRVTEYQTGGALAWD